jgi:hypothetical protein
MILAIESIVACLILTIVILPMQYKNPIALVASYPPEIRKRLESLPEYADSLPKAQKSHIIWKVVFSIFCVIALAFVAYYSGKRNFASAFIHIFIIFFSVNIYDMLILDIGVFCHDKRLRIKGTEDMDAEYKNSAHHIYGAIKGTGIGLVAALLSAGLVELLPM